MDWRDILNAAGIPDESLVGKHCPCPLCGGRDRFRYSNKYGKGNYYCSQCEPGDGITLIMKFNNWEFKQTAEFIERLIGVKSLNEYSPAPGSKPTSNHAQNRKRLGEIKKGLRSLAEPSPVTSYLDSRGVSDVIMQSAKNLWYHPGIKYWDSRGDKIVCIGEFPCMVAVVTCGNTPVTMHLTYLTEGGRKADLPCPRKILPVAAQADYMEIKLFKPTYSDQAATQIGIAEGIETALSVTQLFAVPCWATISSTNMQKWRAPEDILSVGVYGDNDSGGSFAGQVAAYTSASHMVKLGLQPSVHIPKCTNDFNDILMEEEGKS